MSALTVSRKKGQGVVIRVPGYATPLRVKVCKGLGHGRVMLQVIAPREVEVNRDEIDERRHPK